MNNDVQPAAGAPLTRSVTWPLIIALSLSLPMIVLSQIVAHWRFDVVDDQMFGFFGWRIANGGVVYLDVWDNKPPGIYWLNALGFMLSGGESYYGVIALVAATLVLSHLLFFSVAASVFYPGAAALATVLASFYMTHAYYQGGTNRTETFLVFFELAAAAAYMRGWVRDRWWWWLFAGALCGAAFLCKQVGLAAWGAMGVHLIALALQRRIGFGIAAQRCVLLLLGLLLTVGAACAVLAAQGALHAAIFATFGFNYGYIATGNSSFLDTRFNRRMLLQDVMFVLLLPVLMATAALIHGAIWWAKPAFRPVEIEKPIRALPQACPDPLLLFFVWCAVAFYGAQVSPHRFRHYLLPAIPPLLLMAAYLINVLKTELTLARRLAQRGWVVAAFVAMGYFAKNSATLQQEATARVWWDRLGKEGIDASIARLAPSGAWDEVRPSELDDQRGYRRAIWEIIGDEVVRLTQPGETIQCWGYFPGVYLHAKRPNLCRFFTTEKIGQVGDHAEFVRRELHKALTERPPSLFVVSAQDYMWFTERPVDMPKPDWIGEFLATWLDANYIRVVDIRGENVYIYQRRDLVKTVPAQ